MRTDNFVQIDVVKIEGQTTVCNLYTPSGCVKIIMLTSDYEALKRDGFFIWDDKMAKGRDEINTSKAYYAK